MNPTWRSCLLALACATLRAEDPAPKVLFDPAQPGAADQLTPNEKLGETTFAVQNGAVEVAIKAGGQSSYPGVVITPPAPWNAAGFGHVETTITNTGTNRFRATLRIDNPGPWQNDPYSAESVGVGPGETKTLSAIFGYRWGGKAWPLNPEALVRAIVFTGKSVGPQSFRISALRAAGPADEKPFVDPNSVAAKPPKGAILANLDAAKQLVAKGAKVTASDAVSFTVEFAGVPDQSVLVKPVSGMWNLNEHLQVRVRVRNAGKSPVTPTVQLQSRAGASDTFRAPQPLAPGAEAEVVAPFIPAKPWQGADLPAMHEGSGPARNFEEFVPGTGTQYASNKTTGIAIGAEGSAPATLQVASIVADVPPRPPLPDWLGKRPPVEGDWTKTFEDNFDGNAIDLKKWCLYTEGEWHLGKETGFSKDNVIVKDGTLLLRVEKRQVHHNDNPAYPVHPYATGWAETYGKWTQRYGYFEARVKLPKAPHQFTAFWLMPDRGLEYSKTNTVAYGETRHYQRNSTNGKGMEFDIMEQLSIWGPNRHDFGMHWDHYMKNHKALGTFGCYFPPDEEGFLTVGMLWTPGSVVMFQQGRESARWECPRVGALPSYIILQHITGGWETEGMDESQLPSDLVFDYVRVWQRKDLASDVDGPKPNDGGPLPPK